MAKGTKFLPDLNEELLRHLQDENVVSKVSMLFAKLKTNERRVTSVYQLLQECKLLPDLSLDGKSSKQSEEYRQRGNEMFKKKKAREAHEFYTKSIAFAETGSDTLALAYANRSAVLFEKGLYEECLSDIELALQNNYPDNLNSKLRARQSKAKNLLPTREKIDYFTPIPSISGADQNPLIQSAANNIKIETSNKLGRHIVATRDIDPGEIIAIEKSFCHVLTEQYYIHCHHCLQLSYTLIPCPKCTEALFCSKTCQTDANLAYHQYECPILLTIKNIDLSCRLLHLRVAILARNQYGVLSQCVLEKDGVYRSDRYNEIHNLVANTSSRSVSDLFSRAVNAAAFFHLLKSFSTFFEGKNEDFEDTFKELLLFHMQTGPCNFHEVTEIKSSDNSLEQQEIGAAAYAFLSMFNHSCAPNVVRYNYGSTIIAITVDRIKKGEQCFDNYGYHHAVMPKADRKAKLKKHYFFDCTCTACANDYPLYDLLTGITDSKYVVSPRDLKMLEEYNLEEAKKIFKKLVKQIGELGKNKPSKNLAELQEALKQCYFIFRTIKTPI